MNIVRYKTEYLEQVISLLKDMPNGVHLPSDVFEKIGKQFENEPSRESLDKLLESPNARCTQGKIVHADKTYRSDNKMRFYCEFNDGKQKRRVRVPYRSSSNLVRHNKTKVLVVFDEDTAVVLVRKGVYPDVFTMVYYRN